MKVLVIESKSRFCSVKMWIWRIKWMTCIRNTERIVGNVLCNNVCRECKRK